ncbi:MAG: hypothetical protein JWP27_3048, partial [Flaviaesturariibacter sp.]|nr:hypothetical protein [Flaviaesturariibacter sp.]
MADDNKLRPVMFSRKATIAPLGALTEPAKTYVDFDTMQAFRIMVNKAGMDVSSAMRDWIYLKVHGKSYTDICAEAAKVSTDSPSALRRTMFSRRGMIAPLGTLTEQAKTYVDFDTMQKFRAMVNDAGMDLSSALRDWIYLKVHGKTYTDFCVDAA